MSRGIYPTGYIMYQVPWYETTTLSKSEPRWQIKSKTCRVDLVRRCKLHALERIAGLGLAIVHSHNVQTVRGKRHHTPALATHEPKPAPGQPRRRRVQQTKSRRNTQPNKKKAQTWKEEDGGGGSRDERYKGKSGVHKMTLIDRVETTAPCTLIGRR